MDTNFAMWIIGGMGTAILGMAGYIVALHVKINRMYDERIKSLEGNLQLLTVVRQGQPPAPPSAPAAPAGGNE